MIRTPSSGLTRWWSKPAARERAVVGLAVAGQRDEERAARPRASRRRRRAELVAVHAGQADVEQKTSAAGGRAASQRRQGRRGPPHLVAQRLQQRASVCGGVDVVVDHQDAPRPAAVRRAAVARRRRPAAWAPCRSSGRRTMNVAALRQARAVRRRPCRRAARPGSAPAPGRCPRPPCARSRRALALREQVEDVRQQRRRRCRCRCRATAISACCLAARSAQRRCGRPAACTWRRCSAGWTAPAPAACGRPRRGARRGSAA